MKTKEEVFAQCTIDGTTIKLPTEQFDRKLYEQVKKSLEGIGGTWNRKHAGFVFKSDPSKLFADISSGVKRNIKKEFQFFETPAFLADEMVAMAEIRAKHFVLEPSAGQGAIVKAFGRRNASQVIYCCELMDENRDVLKSINNVMLLNEKDFLLYNENERYDRIVANPPFSKNQDIDHIRKMYSHLNKGGRIVTLASRHWQASKNKKETEFRDWLYDLGATFQNVPAGTFSESGTNIPTVIIIIDKD